MQAALPETCFFSICRRIRLQLISILAFLTHSLCSWRLRATLRIGGQTVTHSLVTDIPGGGHSPPFIASAWDPWRLDLRSGESFPHRYSGEMNKTAIIIIAGGSADRMGGTDKPLLQCQGRTLLEHIAERLRPQADYLALNVPTARRDHYHAYIDLFDAVLHDPQNAPPTPVAGIMAGMSWAAHLNGVTRLMTWPGDSPFPSKTIVERLQFQHPQALAPHDGERLQVLAANWPLIDPHTIGGHQSVYGALDSVGYAIADCADIAASFTNINTDEDLAAIK